MSILRKILGSRRQAPTASVAKERLQIIISHERRQSSNSDEDYLIKIQKEIVAVIAKYVEIDMDQVKVQLERSGENAILELNVTMPERALVEEV